MDEGVIDEVAVWDRKLSVEEIAAQFAAADSTNYLDYAVAVSNHVPVNWYPLNNDLSDRGSSTDSDLEAAGGDFAADAWLDEAGMAYKFINSEDVLWQTNDLLSSNGTICLLFKAPPEPVDQEYYAVNGGSHVLADVDAAGDVLRSYTYGPGIDNILSMTTHAPGETNTYFYIKDHLNSVIAVVDGQGQVVEFYEYDAWGNPTAYDGHTNHLTGSVIGNRFLFQGREYSWRTGLYNFRARWYDPQTGRWLSKDPIGISGGFNQYCFVGNHPTTMVDPLGLWQNNNIVSSASASGAYKFSLPQGPWQQRLYPHAARDGIHPCWGGYPIGAVGLYQDYFDSRPEIGRFKNTMCDKVNNTVAHHPSASSIPVVVIPNMKLDEATFLWSLWDSSQGLGDGFSVHGVGVQVAWQGSSYSWTGMMYISEGYGFSNGKDGDNPYPWEIALYYTFGSGGLDWVPTRSEYIAGWPIAGSGSVP